jgi:hypothetical protein
LQNFQVYLTTAGSTQVSAPYKAIHQM